MLWAINVDRLVDADGQAVTTRCSTTRSSASRGTVRSATEDDDANVRDVQWQAADCAGSDASAVRVGELEARVPRQTEVEERAADDGLAEIEDQ